MEKNKDSCPICKSKIKKENNSLHTWEIEYECGTKIWGAIDVNTHGDAIEFENKCKDG